MSAPVDVLVVGAGPAGAITALGLARRGRRVLLLDRYAFPRAKPCGDCLSAEAARVLDRLALLRGIEALDPARLDGWRIWSARGSNFTGCFEPAAGSDVRVRTAIAVSRERLDAALLRTACDAGVELLEPARVVDVLRDGPRVTGIRARGDDGAVRELRARLVVGADGLRSVVARRAGAILPTAGLRKYSLTFHPRLASEFTGGAGEMHVVRGGCIGIAPVARGARPAHNVTFVTASHARDGAADAVMRSMIDDAPGLRARRDELLAALTACEAPLASGPFDRPARFVVADGLALVGDAAGYYDPFTGQGIFQALSAAERLAQVADIALERTGVARAGAVVRERELRPYARWLRRTQRSARTVQHAIEFVTARPRLMNGFTLAIGRAPRFADALVAVTGDMAPARSLIGAPLLSIASGIARSAMRSST